MFTTHRVTTLAATAIAAAGLGLSALTGAPTAGALTSVDANFLDIISDEGIAYDSPGTAVSAAMYVCESIDDGADPADLGNELLATTDLTVHQAAVFVVASVFHYCPEYEDLLP
ncbi:hypothetical protein CQY20_24390 [Mycolicibacterium agri]|uniref:DUF732 domain-containing protein n=1 Tax=Mycolicibacterium agri TaxID=36811 RepID=A0A2A7MSI7_MYCAG|nr:DUF732 domain-containing protein [Mycolicibacterium agri]PEG34666.1 hypothetical protein CQY20_24390 [Mycolicibacterium agri]GFG55499.1 hypothetical protein MAGR_69400 [Mycolicibacterium agri]